MSKPTVSVNLVVLYVPDIEVMKDWLCAFGLIFETHQHGNGPIHYGCEQDGLVLELYPATDNNPSTHCRLGLQVESASTAIESARKIDARIVIEPKQSPWGIRSVIELPNGMKLELLQVSTP